MAAPGMPQKRQAPVGASILALEQTHLALLQHGKGLTRKMGGGEESTGREVIRCAMEYSIAVKGRSHCSFCGLQLVLASEPYSAHRHQSQPVAVVAGGELDSQL